MSSRRRLLARLRRALPQARGLLLALAVLFAGEQLALQAHLVSHDLLPAGHAVCEQCVVAKSVALPPTPLAVRPEAVCAAARPVEPPRSATARAPLVDRSRGPPAVA
jgi:hypothetical protein